MVKTVNVRVDENIKRDVEILFEELGMNISTAVNVFFRQALEEQALPFQPKRKRHKTLRQRMEEHYGKDFDTILKDNPYKFEEWDTGEPVGREVF